MSDAITVALIGGALTLTGTIITAIVSYAKQQESASKQQAVTDTKLENLTREVREHNNFARRVPVLEEQMKNVTARIDKIEERIE